MHSLDALSKSASGSIIALFLPPSSMRQGLRFWPQWRATCLPVLVLPVKLTFLIAGCSIKVFTILGELAAGHERMFRTPDGKPASEKTLPIAQ